MEMKIFLSVLTLAAVYAIADVDEPAPDTLLEAVSEAPSSQQDSVLDLNQEESKCIPPDIHPCALPMCSNFSGCRAIRGEFSQEELDSIAKEKWSVATGQKRDSLAREFRDEIGVFLPEVCLFQFVQYSKNDFPVEVIAFGEDTLKVIGKYTTAQINICRNFKNGKLHEKIYDDNGNLKRTVSYKNGVKEGKEKTYAKDGWLERERSFSAGKLSGSAFEYDEYGNKVNESIYKNGVIQKKIQYGNYSDKLNYHGFFGGDGCKASYGCLSFQCVENAEKKCNCIEKYKEKIFSISQTLYKNGTIHSKTEFYYPCYDGNIEENDKINIGVNKIYSTANYKNGELNGTVKEFYPDGKIKSTVTYEDGEAVSEKKCFSKNGKVQKIGTENMECD